jgi:tetratricopeptide (TPR) repeat protein
MAWHTGNREFYGLGTGPARSWLKYEKHLTFQVIESAWVSRGGHTAVRGRTILAVRQVPRVKLPLLLLLSGLLCGGCALQPRSPPAPADAAAQVKQAQALVGDSQWAQADVLLRHQLARADFQRLEVGQQHALVSLAALVALQNNDARRGLALSRQACGFADSDARDWFTRMRAADGAGDPQDAVLALTTLAERWPQVLARLPDYDAIQYVMFSDLKSGATDAQRYRLLAALHKIKFLDEPGGSGRWWREFALLQLARGERLSAVQTLARITDPYVIASIEADRRFDQVRDEPGALLAVPAAVEESIEAEVRHVQVTPDRLEPMNHLAELLINCERPQQALAVTDAAMEHQEEEHGAGAWSDYERQYEWVLSNRADALFFLGRYDAAVAQLLAASHLHQLPAQNVSAIIDLAEMYNELGQTQQAAATLERVAPADVSAYGRMQLEKEKLSVALALQDERSATRALDYLRAHREDAIGTYQEALLAAHRDDDGAALLIERLRQPEQRSDALLAVQGYADGAQPAAVLEERARWRALLDRADVQQALTSVGRTAKYPLLMPAY